MGEPVVTGTPTDDRRACTHSGEMDRYVTCEDCGLHNDAGHWACVRCGAGLPDGADVSQ